jgi:hypothetical protein
MSTSEMTRAIPFRGARLLVFAALLASSASPQAGQRTAPVQVRGYIQPTDNCVVRSQNSAGPRAAGTPPANASLIMNCAVGVDYEVRETVAGGASTATSASDSTGTVGASEFEESPEGLIATSQNAKKVASEAASLFGRGTGTDQKFWLGMAAMGGQFVAFADVPSTPGAQKNITISW